MKTTSEMRLECLRMAVSLGSSKMIQPDQVIPRAMEFFRWVDGRDDVPTANELSQLAGKYARRS